MRYGIPYLGSKNKLAERIVSFLPRAEHLYDVFCGGCAIAHCAALSGKWGHIHINDISDMPQLFMDAIAGKYRDERRWISREDFFALKDREPYVRSCWSFGNNGQDYLYSREIEPYKRAVWMMLTADSVRERRQAYREVVRQLAPLIKGKSAKESGNNQSLESLESLERLERLQSLERLEDLQRLNGMQDLFAMSKMDYRDLGMSEGSVIYADPPYSTSTQKRDYGGGFDYEAFYAWCEVQTQPLFISEYSMPEDRFVCIAQWDVVCSKSATNKRLRRVEKLWRPKGQYEQAAQDKQLRLDIWG
nr:MAG TPA: DNA adenine methylase [Bacteriophage sp.]